MISIVFTRLPYEIAPAVWENYMGCLSPEQQAAIRQYYRKEDRYRALAGKILIAETLKAFGLEGDRLLRQIQLTASGKPYLEGTLDFNLAHSGNMVVCAGSSNCRLGIDIEAIRTIAIEDFRSVLTEEEWRQIGEAADPCALFFQTWVRKESAIKADGRGLQLALQALETGFGTLVIQHTGWHITDLDCWEGYAACLATSEPARKICFREFVF